MGCRTAARNVCIPQFIDNLCSYFCPGCFVLLIVACMCSAQCGCAVPMRGAVLQLISFPAELIAILLASWVAGSGVGVGDAGGNQGDAG